MPGTTSVACDSEITLPSGNLPLVAPSHPSFTPERTRAPLFTCEQNCPSTLSKLWFS